MQRLIFLVLATIVATYTEAQVKFGVVLLNITSTTQDLKKPLEVGQNVLATATYKTDVSLHSLRYGFGDNSIKSFNTFFLKNDWDAYLLYSKSISNKNQYLGIGLEKMKKINDDVKFFIFTEAGVYPAPSFSFGVSIALQY